MSKIIDGLLRGDLTESELILSKICGETPASTHPRTARESEVVFAEWPGPTRFREAPPKVVVEPAASIPSLVLEIERRTDYTQVSIPALQAILANHQKHGRIAGEQYRVARTKITQHPLKPKVILISSVAPGDGKTTTAVRLAIALSLSSQGDVLLLDADLRRSSVETQLGLSRNLNLAKVLSGKCRAEDAIIRTSELPSLCILPAGNAAENPAELFDSPDWKTLSGELRKQFQYIVIDSPPMSPFADYEILQSAADGVVMIVTPDHTPRRELANAIRSLRKEKFLGIVLNRVSRFFLFKPADSSYYAYYSDRIGDGTPIVKGGGDAQALETE